MGLFKKEFEKDTIFIIDKLGELPLLYDGDLDKITTIIDNLKSKFPSHFYYLDSFINENLKYFINGALYYSKFAKLVRSNSFLENYNRNIKEYLGEKKTVSFLNFLSFIKREDEKFFKEFK